MQFSVHLLYIYYYLQIKPIIFLIQIQPLTNAVLLNPICIDVTKPNNAYVLTRQLKPEKKTGNIHTVIQLSNFYQNLRQKKRF